jgi:hypothetical protein
MAKACWAEKWTLEPRTPSLDPRPRLRPGARASGRSRPSESASHATTELVCGEAHASDAIFFLLLFFLLNGNWAWAGRLTTDRSEDPRSVPGRAARA